MYPESMFKLIVIVAVILLAPLLIYAATKPDTFRVQRSASIKAPPEKIFPHINDLQSWGAWSPWERMDPAMKRTHSGAANGKGDSTNVTWAMYGPNPYMARVIHTFFSMDSMVGKQFEAGLANLRTVAEK